MSSEAFVKFRVPVKKTLQKFKGTIQCQCFLNKLCRIIVMNYYIIHTTTIWCVLKLFEVFVRSFNIKPFSPMNYNPIILTLLRSSCLFVFYYICRGSFFCFQFLYRVLCYGISFRGSSLMTEPTTSICT